MATATATSPDTISLIGMPGAGKSTTGVLLAKLCGLRFVDTDLDIQVHAGATLQQILERDGHLQPGLAEQPVEHERAGEVGEQRREPEKFLVTRVKVDDGLRKHAPAVSGDQPVEMPVRVTELPVDCGQALEQVRDVQVPGHTHAAVNLHAE